MNPRFRISTNHPVVLLAEDVDRNLELAAKKIESEVVLLAEDVDRNVFNQVTLDGFKGRPPRGGRG